MEVWGGTSCLPGDNHQNIACLSIWSILKGHDCLSNAHHALLAWGQCWRPSLSLDPAHSPSMGCEAFHRLVLCREAMQDAKAGNRRDGRSSSLLSFHSKREREREREREMALIVVFRGLQKWLVSLQNCETGGCFGTCIPSMPRGAGGEEKNHQSEFSISTDVGTSGNAISTAKGSCNDAFCSSQWSNSPSHFIASSFRSVALGTTHDSQQNRLLFGRLCVRDCVSLYRVVSAAERACETAPACDTNAKSSQLTLHSGRLLAPIRSVTVGTKPLPALLQITCVGVGFLYHHLIQE